MSQAATSPALLRRVNLEEVLAAVRGSGAVTVADLMAATGLTRATVLAVCEDLIRSGLVHELANQRASGGDYTKGRPARRFAFSARSGVVVGVDLGQATMTTVVADLIGEPLARVTRTLPVDETPAHAERLAQLDAAIKDALLSAGASVDEVLAVTVGVPAPVSRAGDVLDADAFWEVVGVDARAALGQRYGWHVQMENDANLAALGEQWKGAAQDIDDAVALLAGNRLGAGVIESGRLLHGSGGGIGEMAYLLHVEGVGTAQGIALMARIWGREAVQGRRRTTLRAMCAGDPDALSAEMVFAAAADGDPVAAAVVGRLAQRMATVIATMSSLLNPERVIICGAVARAAGSLVDQIAEALSNLTPTPPDVVASTLGDHVVTLGAIRHALAYVDANLLDIALPPARDPKGSDRPDRTVTVPASA